MQIALKTIASRIINRVVVMFAKTVRGFHLKICRLNKKLVLEEEKNKLEEEFSNVYTGSLKAGYFLMIVSSLMKNYLDCQLARKLRNIKLYMNIWILEKIVKILNTMNLQKIMKKIGQMFCLHQAFCHLH